MSGRKRKQEPIDFIVTTSDGTDASAAANRRRVRSVAALKSWPERRRKTFQNGETVGPGHQSTFLVEESTPRKQVKPHPAQWQDDVQRTNFTPSLSPAASYAASSPGPSSAQDVSEDAKGQRKRVAFDNDPHVNKPESEDAIIEIPRLSPALSAHGDHLSGSTILEERPDTPCRCQICERRRMGLPTSEPSSAYPVALVPIRRRMAGFIEPSLIAPGGDVSLITPPATPDPVLRGISSGRADPFNQYPVPYQPWFDGILHHMLNIYAPRGWPALNVTREQGNHWEWFMTQNALKEPALFYVRLLFGSGDLIHLGSMQPQIMYWLRAQAIKAINEALEDSKRAISDAMIIAVGRIALHESLYGDRDAANQIHRPAQKRMIAMRGGMSALDFPPLVKRLMRWADRVMAMQSGTDRIMDDDDNQTFTIEESRNVLDHWVPEEAQTVRGNIRISDIINEKDAG